MLQIETHTLCYLVKAGNWTGLTVVAKQWHRAVRAPVIEGAQIIKEDCWEIEAPFLSAERGHPWRWFAAPSQLVPIATLDPYGVRRDVKRLSL